MIHDDTTRTLRDAAEDELRQQIAELEAQVDELKTEYHALHQEVGVLDTLACKLEEEREELRTALDWIHSNAQEALRYLEKADTSAPNWEAVYCCLDDEIISIRDTARNALNLDTNGNEKAHD